MDERHYEYLQEKFDVINRARASSGDDLIELPTTTQDIKLAMMDPKLYAIGMKMNSGGTGTGIQNL